MKSNEFRINNLVKYNDTDEIFTIEEILEFGLSVKNDNEATYMEYENFSPIPLNKEWLIRFGFEKLTDIKQGYKSTSFSLNNGNVIIMFDDNILTVSWRIELKIRYVHQLQNLIFSLTNEELTLKQ